MKSMLPIAVGLLTVSVALPARAEEPAAEAEKLGAPQNGGGPASLGESDRVFLIATQADTLPAMGARVGTVEQLQAVTGLGAGFASDLNADFAPLSWLQLGLSITYGTIGDPATQSVLAPTVFVKAQFLRAESAPVNAAFGLQFKKFGFGRVSEVHVNAGEFEGMLLVDGRLGHLALTGNAVFGKSVNVPDSDAELKIGAGYYVLPNLVLGVDMLGRYDTSFDGGPADGTRYWELMGGPMTTWKVGGVTLSALVGLSAPMHSPAPTVAGPALGPMAMGQASYAW